MAHKPTAAPEVAADVAATPEADHAQTWIQYVDAKGKTRRVKSEDYKEGA